MSVNKTILQSEIINDPRKINEHLTKAESQQSDYLELFKHKQEKISNATTPVQEMADDYFRRDDAYFKYLQNIRQFKSEALLLNDYHQPAVMPRIEHSNSPIISLIERYNRQDGEFLAHVELYRQAKQAHQERLEELQASISRLESSIQNIVIPQILYFLLQYFPIAVGIYRYFYPDNKLDQGLEIGRQLNEDYEEQISELEQINKKFHKQWQDTGPTYEAVSDDQLQRLRDNKAVYSRLLQKHDTMSRTLSSYAHPTFQQAYAEFQKNPTHTTLFELVRQITEYQYKATLAQNESTVALEGTLITLQELYPEVKHPLDAFHKDILNQLSATEMRDAIRKLGHALFTENKTLSKKIENAHHKREEYERKRAELLPLVDYKARQELDSKLKKLDQYLEITVPKYNQQTHFTNLLGDFWTTNSGESLKNLYEFCSDPESASYQQDTARYLKSLYPEAIKQLELEQAKNMFYFPHGVCYKLMTEYLKELVSIQKSSDPASEPYKDLAKALNDFLSYPTWKNLSRIERAIRRNPNYYKENPRLASLIKELMDISVNAEELQIKARKKPVIESDELLINQDNPRPTFFQPTAKQEKTISQLYKKMLEAINIYKIACTDKNPSDENKQSITMDILGHITRYIEVLSEPDSLSPHYRQLLKDIATFLLDIADNCNKDTLAQMQKKLEQLDEHHPIRQAVEFLIETTRSKETYVAIDTAPAKSMFQQELQQTLERQKELLAKTQSRSSSVTNAIKNRRVYNIREIARLIDAYTEKLKQHASNDNKQEHETLVALLHDFDVEAIIREFSPQKSEAEMKKLLNDFYIKLKPTLVTLDDHPIIGAVKQCLLELKEITKLHDSPSSTLSPKK